MCGIAAEMLKAGIANQGVSKGIKILWYLSKLTEESNFPDLQGQKVKKSVEITAKLPYCLYLARWQ